MSLVTVQRSPTPSNSLEDDAQQDNVDNALTEISDAPCDSQRSVRSLPRQRSLASECYFAVKGAALILPQNECVMIPRQSNSFGGEIQLHLQAMLHLLRAQDTLKMAVRLENFFSQHTRYMAIVSTMGRQDNHESILVGIDYVSPDETTIGLVIPIWASTSISLDGDGGINVESNGSQFLFKPMSVQAMWSAFQSLHKEHDAACSSGPYFPGGLTHTWVQYYEARILSKEAFRSAWHYVYSKDETEALKADSMQRYTEKPPEKASAEKMIRSALKIIMQSVDLDEVTSKDIREKLEERLNMNLTEFKEFVDQEMLIILGQMDQPSQVFPHLYLGTEWNASNWDELRQNNVGYILNVTKEVDNFFPGMFYYMKIRVSDEESTELLRHWDLTYKFITKAKENNSAVLVHCKKGISRSSSTVVAYAMKCFGWSLEEALNYVKEKRDCITPNKGFMQQLRTYQGILEASQHRKSALFNQSQTTPVTPDLVPWEGLIDEYVEEEQPSTSNFMDCRDFSRDNEGLCQISEKSVDSEHSSEHGRAGSIETPPPHRLLVASENILKSGPPPPPAPHNMAQSEDLKNQSIKSIEKLEMPKIPSEIETNLIKFSISVEENEKNQEKIDKIQQKIDKNLQKIDQSLQKMDKNQQKFDEDSMPDLNLRLPLRKRLKNVEKFEDQLKPQLPTLKNVQEILMRKNLHNNSEKSINSGSTNQKREFISTSDSGSSLTVSSSGDEEESDGGGPTGGSGSGSSGPGHVTFLGRRRNSKSSSGDSAVADLTGSLSSSRDPKRAGGGSTGDLSSNSERGQRLDDAPPRSRDFRRDASETRTGATGGFAATFGTSPKSPVAPFQRPRLGTAAAPGGFHHQTDQSADPARMRRPASYASGLVPAGRVKRFTRKYEMKNRRSSPSLATKTSFDQSDDDHLSDHEFNSTNNSKGGNRAAQGPPPDPTQTPISSTKKSGPGRKLFERFFPPSVHHQKKANFQSFV